MSEFATAEGTARYADDEPTDRAYSQAVMAAVDGGVNVMDFAINYRNHRSERSIGAALGEIAREEVVLGTEAGYLTPGAVPGTLRTEDIVGGMHSMAPEFLADQIDRSLANLCTASLEETAALGKVHYYGAATWNGFRRKPGAPDALDLERLTGIATRVAGTRHHFRFIQVPFNLAMTDAFTNGTLEIATRAGITVMESASNLQGRLASEKPPVPKTLLPGLETAAQRAIQFPRSSPGITTVLAGMSSVAHLNENLALALVLSLEPDQYLRIYDH